MKRLISFFLSALMILGAFAIPAAAAEGTEATAPAEKVYGDANCDGVLNITDAIDLAKYILGWELETFSSALADYTLEGDLNILDAIRIAEVIAGYDYDPEQTLIENSGVEVIDFDVPEPTPTEAVSSAEFGFDTAAEDNRAAFQAAADYLAEHPGTTLLFESGTYKMSAGVSFTGVQNCVVDGGGSTFLFRSASYFSINGATDSFMMTNFHVEWDYELGGMIASTDYSCGTVFTISDAANVTVRDVNIYSTPAGGFAVNGAGTHHIKLDGVNIGIKPEHAAWESVSTGSDCIRVEDMGGYLIVENSNMGFGGEDILNIHANVGRVTEVVSEDTLRMQVTNGNPFSQGCSLVFKDMTTFEDYEYTAAITEYSYFTNEAGERFVEAKVDSPLPDYIDENTVVINPDLTCENYIVRNNYFHEEQGRAQVIGAGNGLIENNRYYGFRTRVTLTPKVDYGELWYEGTGVDNLIIRNNTFEACGSGDGDVSAIIDFSAVSDFESIDGTCFNDILIYDNVFTENFVPVALVTQADNITFAHNIIDDTMEITDPYEGTEIKLPSRGRVMVTGELNSVNKIKIFDNTWLESPYIADNANEVDASYALISGGKVTDKNNVIEDIPMDKIISDNKVLDPTKEYNILFVGNSYTYYNDMPEELFAPIAESVGYTFNVKQLTKGGWCLYDSANAEDDLGALVDAELKATKYDFVILQEQSTNPGNNRGKFYDGVRRLVEKIEENGATPLLYGTWGRANESETLDQNGWTNESMTWLIASAYEAIGAELGIDVAHAGFAFYDIYNNYAKGDEIYADDYTHPSAKGSYLAALTLFAELTGVDPTTVTFRKGLNQREAMDYRESARKAVFETPEIPEEYKTSSEGVVYTEEVAE